MAREARRDAEPIRITTAASSRNENIAARQRRYLLSMGLRTVCFVLAIVFRDSWPMWVFLAGALILPYVAVVMPTATSSRSDDFQLVDRGYGRPELPAGPEPRAAGGQDHLGSGPGA